MAYNNFEYGLNANSNATQTTTFQASAEAITLPHASYIRDAQMQRDGMDLSLQTDQGHIIIENYFAVETKPTLSAPDGSSLSPKLVESFVQSSNQYASNATMTDVSPVGSINEISGQATVTRVDGSTETLTLGTEIYQGDIVETAQDAAVNISFIDETSFAVSEGARLSIDEYVYDPATESGQTDFSVLKGMFVYTSGLIGRDDPDDVTIDTPVGSIGIRGTIIAGDVDLGEITVVEGAIVLRDFNGNEVTLANQFETARFAQDGGSIEALGQMSAADVATKFVSVSNVSPTLFSSINDAATEAEQSAKDAEGDKAADEGKEEGAEGANDAPQDGEVKTEAEAPKDTKTDGKDGNSDVKANGKDAQKADTAKGDTDNNTATKVNADRAEAPNAADPANNPNSRTGPREISEPVQNTLNTLENRNNPFADFNARKLSQQSDQTSTSNNPNLQTALADPNQLRTTELNVNNKPTINHDVNLAKLLKLTPDGADGFKWILDLGQIFSDAETPNDLTYYLTVESESGDNVTVNQIIDSYHLGTKSGELELNFDFANIWDDTQVLDLNDITFNVRAEDTSDNFSNTYSFILDGITGNTINEAGLSLFIESATSNNIQLSGDNNIFYLDNSTTNVDIGFMVEAVIPKTESLKDSTVFIGNKKGTVTINNVSEDNTIYGSNETTIEDSINETAGDDFHVHNADNTILAGNGNDTIKLFWDNNAVKNNFDGTSQQHSFDGGNNFDTLKFFSNNENNLNLNFEQILNDTNIKNFEKLDVYSTGNATVTLTLDQVISMTDGNNELYINGDVSGSFDLNLEGYDVATSELEMVDGALVVNDANDDGYIHYTDGTANLYVEAALLDGTAT